MKLLLRKLWIFACVCLVCSCSSLEDSDHYNNISTNILNDELKITSLSSEDYIGSRSDLSDMNSLFHRDSIYDQLHKKNQVSTMLVVTNDNYVEPSTGQLDYVAKSHISDIGISPANMYNGERLMMWHGKYVNIDIDSLGKEGHIIDHIMFNNAAVKEVIKTADGYIYIINGMITTPVSLYDYINSLDDNYSEFKQMVLKSGQFVFDHTNSKVIGVNDQGNTVYDSVFIYKNTFFSNKGLDLNSESTTATMLLCSNKVIDDAIADANARLASWGLDRNQDTLRNWILKAVFFNKKYPVSEIQTSDINDLTSIFGEQWRTNIQKVDNENPISLSNGIVYKVTDLHLPTNLLIYRLKDYFYYYENCTDVQKASYFQAYNMTFHSCDTEVDAWTPWSGVWPLHQNRVLAYTKNADVGDAQGFQLDFVPVKLNIDGSVSPYLIPPGTYRLAMGFVQNAGVDITVSVLVNGKEISKSNTVTLGSATTYHYDRGATLANTYPEGFDPSYVTQKTGNKKASNYDTDGGPVIDEVTVPDIKGDGSPSQIVLRVNCENWNGKTTMKFHHWCLRPTVNNY